MRIKWLEVFKDLWRYIVIAAILVAIAIGLILSEPAKGAEAAEVALQWDANTEPDLAGYKIYSGNQSRVYVDPVILGKITSYTATIPDGVTAYYSVTAFDTEGLESEYSNEVSTNGRPAAPGALRITVTVNVNMQ